MKDIKLTHCYGRLQDNNGGKNGTKIRLHENQLRQLDQRGTRFGSSFLLDNDVHRYERDHGKKQNRNFVPDRISPGAGNGSLDSQTIDPSGQKADQKIDWLQNQCWRKIYGKVYEPMVEILQRQDLGKNAQKIASSKLGLLSNPRPEMAWDFLCLENEKKEKGTGDKQHATRHKLRYIYWVGPAHRRAAALCHIDKNFLNLGP